MNRLRSILILLILPSLTFAQEWVPPLNIPLVLSGNFGEIRSNHFHTGIDIKTQGRTGLPIFAVADGDVVRIKVSPYGYGKALYVRHNNGKTSVYGHLESFHPTITDWVEEQQYQQQASTVNLFPSPGQFSFKQGEEIAKSGNSGSSGGPHLHFEIRDTKSEEPINPLLYPFKVADGTPPSIYGIQVVALDNNSHVNKKSADNFSMGGTHGNYTIKNGERIEVHGNIGLAIHAIDRLDAANNKCGVFQLVCIVANDTLYKATIDRLNFSTNRYMNAHIDYRLYEKFRKHYHRLFKVENNQLKIYDQLKNQGVVRCSENIDLPVKIIAKDVAGNVSELNFVLSSQATPYDRFIEKSPNLQMVNCTQTYDWKSETASVQIPANCLYFSESLTFTTAEEDGLPVLTVGDANTAAQIPFKLSLKIPEKLSAHKDKIFLGKMAANGRVYPDNTGNVEGNWFHAKNREFGTYTFLIDSLAPEIKAFGFYEGKTLRGGNKIRFRIKDNGSGISSYNLFIDDQWALVSYDFRIATVEYRMDEQKVLPGPHVLKLVVEDKLGNQSTYQANFTSL